MDDHGSQSYRVGQPYHLLRMTWQLRYRIRLLTVAAVESEIDRCQDELAAANLKRSVVAQWEQRLAFLQRLSGELATPQLIADEAPPVRVNL